MRVKTRSFLVLSFRGQYSLLRLGAVRLNTESARNTVDARPHQNQNDFKEVPTIPATVTLRNLPDEVYRRLEASAESHRRSLNSEAIVCLEAMLIPSKRTPGERLARARALRAELKAGESRAHDTEVFKRRGRP